MNTDLSGAERARTESDFDFGFNDPATRAWVIIAVMAIIAALAFGAIHGPIAHSSIHPF